MSLTKQVLLPTGFTVDYWRVENVTINPIERTVDVTLNGYKSKADYDLGSAPAANRSFNLNQSEFMALSTPGVVAAAKTWLEVVDTFTAEVHAELAGAVEDPNDVI